MNKMSRWEFLAWTVPLVVAFQLILGWAGVGFLASVAAGIVALIPISQLARKVVRPEDL